MIRAVCKEANLASQSLEKQLAIQYEIFKGYESSVLDGGDDDCLPRCHLSLLPLKYFSRHLLASFHQSTTQFKIQEELYKSQVLDLLHSPTHEPIVQKP